MNLFKQLVSNITLYKIGFILFIIGITQFLVFMALDYIGVLEIGNGLGPGLIMTGFFFLGGLSCFVGLLADLLIWFKNRKTE